MTPVEGFLVAMAAACVGLAWRACRALRRLTPLEPLPAGSSTTLPSVTIVAGARNEQDGIEAAVTSWLGQRGDVQVIVVDDRSTDATADILARMAAGSPRLEVVRIDARPEGWLGKCHALHQGALRARGDFVLFTDADVELAPDTLARALATCVREDADYLTLVPRVDTDDVLQWCLTAAFFHVLLVFVRADLANTDDDRCLLGVGAFSLVRRTAYEGVGGHAEIRMQVGDDVALSRLLARAGHRRRFRSGLDAARVHWQRGGVLATIRGIEKNTFWAARLSIAGVLAFTVGAGAAAAPLLGPLVGGWGWVAFAAWWVAAALPHAAGGQGFARAALGTLAQPLSSMLLLVAAWNSLVVTSRRGGIRWRDDFFSLQELRAGLKPLSWWGVGQPRRQSGAEGRTPS